VAGSLRLVDVGSSTVSNHPMELGSPATSAVMVSAATPAMASPATPTMQANAVTLTVANAATPAVQASLATLLLLAILSELLFPVVLASTAGPFCHYKCPC